MDIKLKYKAWVGEKHADIAHKLIGNDIQTFALEFSEHLVKNYFTSPIIKQSEQFYCMELEELGEKVMHCAKQCDWCLKK